VRLGLRSVQGLAQSCIQKIMTERRHRPFVSLEDFVRRTRLSKGPRQLLAEAGALHAFSAHRREALWQVEALHPEDELFHQAVAEDATPPAEGNGSPAASPLPPMSLTERMQADYRTLGLTVGRHPMALVRHQYPQLVPAASLPTVPNGRTIEIGGAVITRQRPGTAKGVCFITLEDETGLANVIVRPELFEARRLVINLEPALRMRGRLQNDQGVIHLLAEEIRPLGAPELPEGASHDYH
jgi:error-prone DNA polymerase